MRAATDTDQRHGQLLCNRASHGAIDHLTDHCEAADLLQCQGIVDQHDLLRLTATVLTIAAELVKLLRQ